MAIRIPQLQSEVIADVSATSSQTITKDITIEGDALTFVVIMEDVPAQSNLEINVYELKNQIVITPPVLSTGVISGTNRSARFAKVVNNTVRMQISFVGPVNFVVLAKAISAAGVDVVNAQTGGALAGPGIEGTMQVSAVPQEIKVGTEAYLGRSLVIAYNGSNKTMFWGRTPNVTENTGIPIFSNQVASWTFTDTAKLYVMLPDNGGGILRVTESRFYV